MAIRSEILKDLHVRLTVLAGQRGQACPSYECLEELLRNGYLGSRRASCIGDGGSNWEYKYLGQWLGKAPAPDSAEYAVMQEEYITRAVAERLHSVGLPPRHNRKVVERTNEDWATAFDKTGKRLAEHEDAMIAMLGERGTGKTQMAVELIRRMIRQAVESSMLSVENLERWAWRPGGSPVPGATALYANTMDFFLQLRETYQPDSKEQEGGVLKRYVAPSLLVLDEVHDRRGSDWENQMFTYLVDRRYQSGDKQTIFIANQTPAEFEASIGASIADRIHECGGIVKCNWKSFRAG